MIPHLSEKESANKAPDINLENKPLMRMRSPKIMQRNYAVTVRVTSQARHQNFQIEQSEQQSSKVSGSTQRSFRLPAVNVNLSTVLLEIL